MLVSIFATKNFLMRNSVDDCFVIMNCNLFILCFIFQEVASALTEEVSVIRSDETDSRPERQGRRDVSNIL